MREALGIDADTAAEMLIVFGDNPDRVHSEAAFAKLGGTTPPAASLGLTNRHRLSRASNREANAAMYRAVIVRMLFHQPTIDNVTRRTRRGPAKRDIVRCLKRYVRETYRRVVSDHRAGHDLSGPTSVASLDV